MCTYGFESASWAGNPLKSRRGFTRKAVSAHGTVAGRVRLGLLVDEPTQLDRGLLARDVEHVEAAGPGLEPACRRPSAFRQMGFLIVVGRIVGDELQRQPGRCARHLVTGEDHGVALL